MGRHFLAVPVADETREEDGLTITHAGGYRYYIDGKEVSQEQYVAEWDREMAQEWEVSE